MFNPRAERHARKIPPEKAGVRWKSADENQKSIQTRPLARGHKPQKVRKRATDKNIQ